MNSLKAAFMALAASFKPAHYTNSWMPKARSNEGLKKSGKTRRGATHRQGRTFKSRNLIKGMTPAQYRHEHIAIVRRVEPNYTKPHAAPRGSNVQ